MVHFVYTQLKNTPKKFKFCGTSHSRASLIILDLHVPCICIRFCTYTYITKITIITTTTFYPFFNSQIATTSFLYIVPLWKQSNVYLSTSNNLHYLLLLFFLVFVVVIVALLKNHIYLPTEITGSVRRNKKKRVRYLDSKNVNLKFIFIVHARTKLKRALRVSY